MYSKVIQLYIFFLVFFSVVGYYKILTIVPCGKLLLTWTLKDGWDLAWRRQGKRTFQKKGKRVTA